MKRQNVKSSNIKSIGYDSAAKVLEVEFTNGAVWQYEDVPAKVYNDLMTADSVGGYFARNIKPTYKATRQ